MDDLPLLRLRGVGKRGGGVLDGAPGVFAKEMGVGKDKRNLLVMDRAGWHTGGEVEVPEGIHLEFLPSGSPELQPAERLWPLNAWSELRSPPQQVGKS